MSGSDRPVFVKTDGFRWGLSRRALRFIVRRLFRFEIDLTGLEHVPRDESLIVAAAPHRNWIDPFLVLLVLPRRPRIYYLGSREAVFNTWWKRLVVGAFGGVVPVSSVGGLNREALETAVAILRSGATLGIFPEGWGHMADPPDRLAEIKRGVGWLAARTDRRILPVALAGTQSLWRGKTLRVRIGPPISPPSVGSGRTGEKEAAHELDRALRELMPPLPPTIEPHLRPWRWLTTLLD
jgi:1-acyl-sn-glycerol-3-phosphate acyltransferase